MTYEIYTLWSSIINDTVNTTLKEYSRTLFQHYGYIIVRLYYVDEIGVICQHNTRHVFQNSVTDGFYLDYDDAYIIKDAFTNIHYYFLRCIIELDHQYIHYILYRQEIQSNNTLESAINNLFDHYQQLATTNFKIYLLIPTPSYADKKKIASYFSKI